MNTENPTLYIVMPCYNEEEVLPETSRRMLALLEDMIEKGEVSAQSRIMMVDDGSKDDTWNIIQSLHGENDFFSGVKLSGNKGHQYALMAGLMTAKDVCDISISIDADLQDDINVIRDMVAEYKNGAQVVYGVRSERKTDTFFKRFTAQSYYKLLEKMGVDVVFNHADYRLLSKVALEALSEYKEVNLFLRGMVPTLGYKTATVYYARAERFAGESKYPLSKMLALAWQGITSFSLKPIRILSNFGIFFILFGLVYALYRVLFKTFFMTHAIFCSVWIMGGILLVALGIVGQYVGKGYMESKARPRYIIEKILDS